MNLMNRVAKTGAQRRAAKLCNRLHAGAKMIADFGGFGISTQLSLAVVASLLTGGVGLSLLLPIAPPPDDE